MRKKVCGVFVTMLTLLLASQFSFALAPREGRVLAQNEEYTIVSSYDIVALSSCQHDYTEIRVGDIIAENCTHITYNYTEWCNRCNTNIKGGTLVMPRETPQHTIRTYSVGHIKDSHIYENRCSKCGYETGSFTVPCNGPPCVGIV